MGEVEHTARQLAAYLPAAESLVPEPDVTTPAMISGGRVVTVSSPAWNTAAANAVTDVHAGIRHLEQGLRLAVTGTVIRRGGSDACTYSALSAVVNLTVGLEPHTVAPPAGKPCQCGPCRVNRSLARWVNQICRLRGIDEAVRWEPIRSVDNQPVLCPYCDTPSLRAAAEHYLVACGNPACRDDNDKPPVAHMEISSVVDGEGILVWNDGRVT